ncbi:D-alanyl-D-alanine carboxypeptidase/D-alanyl-D-alanine-endopeptidase [Bacillus sp. V5-8f]|uniref:D-alanyl-D-alanine carboxypeptidase/D-alanyl-D-alanine endopeptidase n=1 Tax=Bacillus sp. V5-8f TaxID=2053044 RepID=UPI000C76BB2C|nr:D-alanyl-D-alanine carboxypeptidase/D-alanyl-D-alanine-endopeptidase [Bacillus sp. V5-8f]PLT35079.1 D-alanyl-D-alanine carboxypeptidase/D-alanyl-D-alanine-endopeptidase [Bacillus sp. V5-8f]
MTIYINTLGIVFVSIGITLALFSEGYHAQAVVSKRQNTFDQISNILDHPLLDGSVTGISVRSAESGEILYEHNGNTRLRPASNMKLLTAAAALDQLGENYTFKTELMTDGCIRARILTGNLYLKGYGDPTLVEKDFNEMADALKDKGVKLIIGNIIADDSWYDKERYSKDLPWTDEMQYYGAQISAITAAPDDDYDSGTIVVKVRPGKKVNSPAVVSIFPRTKYVKVINSVKTVGQGRKRTLKIRREHGTNTITAEGTIPVGEKAAKSRVAIWEPTGYALELFTNALQKQGVKVLKRVKHGITPKNATVLVSHRSMPLSQLLVPFMKLSNNTHAETLVKEIGRTAKGEGNWENGLEVMERNLQTLGVDTGNMVIRDGSGVSHVSLLKANDITKLLFLCQTKTWFQTYLNSLPVAGASNRMVGGTLQKRMRNTSAAGNVKAKTGTISTVSSLSGYVSGKSGKKYIFSVLLNNVADEAAVKKVEDQIAILLSNQ